MKEAIQENTAPGRAVDGESASGEEWPRREWICLTAILALGLFLRLWYFSELVHAPDFRALRQDLDVQDYQARAMLSGDWTVRDGENDPEIPTTPYYRPPGYPYFLAIVYWFSNGSYLAPRLVHFALGLTTATLLYLLGRAVFSGGVGLIAAFLYATYWGCIYYEGEVNDPAIFLFLVPSLMLVLLRWLRAFAARWAALAGLIIGCYAIMRPNILLFGPVLAAWMLYVAWRRRQLRRAASSWIALALLAAAPILPVTARNYVVSGEFVPISTYFGQNFLIGNGEDSNGYTSWTPYLQELEGTGNWSVWVYNNVVRGLGREVGNENLTHSEASRIFFWKTVDFIRENKMRTLKLAIKKAAYFWHPLEITENKVVQHEKWHYAPLKYLPGFPWTMALFLGGSLFLTWDWRRGRLPGHSSLDATTVKRIIFIVYAFAFTYFASFIPFFVNARSRAPLYGLMLLIGAYGVKRLWDFAVARQYCRMALGAALFGGMFLISSVPLAPYTPDHDRWHYDRADSYLREGKVEEAIAEARAMMALPERPMYYMPHRLGVAFVRLGRYEEAVPLLRAALSPEPEEQDPRYRQDVHYLLGVALASTNRDAEAVEAYEAALWLNPDDARTHNNLGVIREKQGDFAAAEHHYREAIRSSREFALAYSNLGDLLGRTARLDEAIAHLRRAAELEPDNADYHYNLARHLAMAGRNEEASAHYETAIALRPEDPRPCNNLGWMAQEAGDLAEAERRYRQAVEASPTFTLGWINLMHLMVQEGRLSDAGQVCDIAIAEDPRNHGLRLSFAEVLARYDYQSEAIAEYRKALASEPENPVIMNNLAILLVATGQWREAEALYRRAIESDPAYAPAHCNLGVLLQAQGLTEDAMRYFRQALAIDPDNAFAQKRLATGKEEKR